MSSAQSNSAFNPTPLYEADSLQWQTVTVEQLKQQNLSVVDWQNLIEELEDMGKSERRSLAAVLAESYTEAVRQAHAETGLPLATFPQ